MNESKNLTIIGAGLCGTLLAIRLAQKGYQCNLYEKRSDMRLQDLDGGRSINLALSNRGLKALKLVGLDKKIMEECIPMQGRMIHLDSGDTHFSKYSGREGEYINSVSRSGLNITLLNEASKYENISIKFNQSCQKVDLKNSIAIFKDYDTQEILEVKSDYIFGTDGAGSAVRKSMLSNSTSLLFNYSQEFLRTGYKELTIPAKEDGGFRIDGNSLHIWPRGSYMMIALPNLDGSFTVTCFFPYDGEFGFNQLDEASKIEGFFNTQFKDAVQHMPSLINDFLENPVGRLGTNKCFPWCAYDKILLLGDAAHAIVPFYGQGMNASFEDVTVFDKILEANDGSLDKTLKEFESNRKQDADAIADLALDNFYEMQDHTADPIFQKKRVLETKLEQSFPEYYSKYSMVTFNENMRYSDAIKKGRLQDEYLMSLCKDNSIDEMSLDKILNLIKNKFQ